MTKSVTLKASNRWEVDVHRTLATGPWGQLVRTDDLWDQASKFELGGRQLPTLRPEVHLAHALVHVGLGSPTPRGNNLRDLLQLTATVDPSTAFETLERWQSVVPAQEARSFVPEQLDGALSWLGRREPTRRERRWLELYRRSPQPFRRLTLEAIQVVPVASLVPYLLATAPLARPSRWRS